SLARVHVRRRRCPQLLKSGAKVSEQAGRVLIWHEVVRLGLVRQLKELLNAALVDDVFVIAGDDREQRAEEHREALRLIGEAIHADQDRLARSAGSDAQQARPRELLAVLDAGAAGDGHRDRTNAHRRAHGAWTIAIAGGHDDERYVDSRVVETVAMAHEL